jgi:superfamily II RNA helicase
MSDASLDPRPHFLRFIPADPEGADILESFFEAIAALGITPYPAQEDAIFELMSDKHVILATPTGSGKSLVATAMHFKGYVEGKRSFYTCPIKALVSEKFFALCDQFGAENVGMLTGDASINRDASIICCTAEVLSNFALADGASQIDYVIMDEFHYYSDVDRGVAWQLPLLCMPNTKFLLMSATIGNCEHIKRSLKEITNTDVAEITSMVRPVPLDFNYSEIPLHETLAGLIASKKYPVYVVNFTQRECAVEAQNAMSVNIATKEEKAKIDQALQGFRFDTPFGKDIKRYIRHGVGIHHAGLLPKYRLLMEKLAQAGHLKIIMGTDTLGVGVNVPIRTVVFTKLCKFDGTKTGILSVRDFKQISGRAGRKGFDTEGSVIAQAPEHVIENLKQENKFASDDKRKKKIVKKEPPTKNYVHYDRKTFERLVNEPPEPLESRFRITHGMLLNALSNEEGSKAGYKNLIKIIKRCHDTPKEKSAHRKRAAILFKSLLRAAIISLIKNRIQGTRVVIDENLQKDFSLHHTLSLYLIDALSVLDKAHPEYALDVLSLVESIEENPRAILDRQVDIKKTEALAAMKAEGVEFEERIEALDKIEYDKPLAEFTYNTFNQFAAKHPWVEAQNIHPKSIARAMFERGATFNEYISELGLARSEGLLLRYLSQTYKTLSQTVPDSYKTDEVLDIVAYLRNVLLRVDTSLIDEWESMFDDESMTAEQLVEKPRPSFDPRVSHKAFMAKVRAELFHLVRLLSQKNYEEAADAVFPSADDLWTKERFEEALVPFYAEFQSLIADPRARNPELTKVTKIDDENYEVTHTLIDDQDERSWFLEASIDLASINDEKLPVLRLMGFRA